MQKKSINQSVSRNYYLLLGLNSVYMDLKIKTLPPVPSKHPNKYERKRSIEFQQYPIITCNICTEWSAKLSVKDSIPLFTKKNRIAEEAIGVVFKACLRYIHLKGFDHVSHSESSQSFVVLGYRA
jgi:hypothetical protein